MDMPSDLHVHGLVYIRIVIYQSLVYPYVQVSVCVGARAPGLKARSACQEVIPPYIIYNIIIII